MDHLWSPWRYRFITEGAPRDRCVFCEIRDNPAADENNFVVCRASHNFVVLNLYPYTAGHVLIVPYHHAASLNAIDEATATETMLLTRLGEKALENVYRPDGMNTGMNIGSAAGAGIAQHIHMHLLPRWKGDANFLSTIGETRMLPEELPVTWRKLTDAFAALRDRLR